MKLQVTHETRYDYAPAVDTAEHLAFLQPLNKPHQRLLSHSLKISPEPAQLSHNQDVFGNPRCFFSLKVSHLQLLVMAQSVVTTSASQPPASTISWEATRERFAYQAGGQYDPAAEFLFVSPFVPRHAEFATYARPSFAPGVPLLDCAQDLMRRMHADFTYESASTQINTPALEALAQRKGVCQDFAHIMIACLRAMGIPARYVSGYLLTVPAPGTVKLKGSDASHAWASVYVPDLPEGERWCDLDPTNNRHGWHSPGDDYVTTAIGRDFGDVSPIRGVIYGGASHTLHVAVTVEPLQDGHSQDAPLLGPSQSQTQTQTQALTQSHTPSQTQTRTAGH